MQQRGIACKISTARSQGSNTASRAPRASAKQQISLPPVPFFDSIARAESANRGRESFFNPVEAQLNRRRCAPATAPVGRRG